MRFTVSKLGLRRRHRAITVRVDGTGVMSVAAMTAITTESVSGNRSITQTRLKLNSGLLRAVARGAAGEQIEIVKPDRDKIYQLDPHKKRYQERSIAEMRTLLGQVRVQPPGMPVAFDDSRCQWSAASSKLPRNGREQIAGLGVEQWDTQSAQTCADRQTKRQSDLLLDTRFWMAARGGPIEEQRHFQQQYAHQLGLIGSMNRSTQKRALTGQPLKAEFTLAVDGSHCGTGQANDVGREITSTIVTEKAGHWRLGDLSGQLVGKLLSKKKGRHTDRATASKSDIRGCLDRQNAAGSVRI